jgi:hypothetical protein
VISSCGFEGPMPNGMRSPEPVVVDMPRSIVDSSWKKDTSLYIIHVLKNNIVINHASKEIQIANMIEFNSFIKANSETILKTRTGLEVDSLAYNRIDTVVKILKENDIIEFYLDTDLE